MNRHFDSLQPKQHSKKANNSISCSGSFYSKVEYSLFSNPPPPTPKIKKKIHNEAKTVTTSLINNGQWVEQSVKFTLIHARAVSMPGEFHGSNMILGKRPPLILFYTQKKASDKV